MTRADAVKFFCAAACALAITGCGYEELIANARLPGKLPLPAFADQTVRLALTEELANGTALPGRYLVMFRSDEAPQLFASYLAEYQQHYAPLAERYMTDPRVADINYIDHINLTSLAAPATANERLMEDLSPPPALRVAFAIARATPLTGTLADVKFHSETAAAAALAEWEKAGVIWYAEPNYVSYVSGTFGTYKEQYSQGAIWWHQNIKLYDAFASADQRDTTKYPSDNDLQSPVVAVLDSGLDIDHPAFKGRVWENKAPGASGCDGDAHGCDTTKATKGSFGTGDVYPYKYNKAAQACAPDADAQKNCKHGTHVAGIIAAAYNGSYGGVCPLCLVMPVKIIGEVPGQGGGALDSAILNGMKYITKFVRNNKAIIRVVNSSFGKYSRSRSVTTLVAVLSQAPNEVLVVGAASNEDSMLRTYPASLDQAIAVSALDRLNRNAKYSNYGPWVDVAAPGGYGTSTGDPGEDILSTVPGSEGAATKVGTSMACPVVAGVAGLVLTVDPNRSFQQLRNSIVMGADPMIYRQDVANGYNFRFYLVKPEGEDSKIPLLGAGVVDAKAAIDGTVQAAGFAGTKISRVQPGCSAVGGVPATSAARWWLIFGLFPPLVVAFSRRINH